MNSRAKGRKAEKEYQKMLEEDGYLVEITKGSQMFNKSVDFFGMFDLIALNKEHILLIQVKSNTTQGWIKKCKNWLEYNEKYLPYNCECILAVRIDGKGGKKVKWKVKTIEV